MFCHSTSIFSLFSLALCKGVILTSQPRAINIPSIDAKDLYLANHTVDPNPGGFSLKYRSGDININRFYATIPFSLDMIKLREVYDKVYRNSRFSFFIGEKEYSTRVINVTFNYSVKEFNKLGKDTYIRNGYLARNVDFEDCACVRDGQLVGIKCGKRQLTRGRSKSKP